MQRLWANEPAMASRAHDGFRHVSDGEASSLDVLAWMRVGRAGAPPVSNGTG